MAGLDVSSAGLVKVGVDSIRVSSTMTQVRRMGWVGDGMCVCVCACVSFCACVCLNEKICMRINDAEG